MNAKHKWLICGFCNFTLRCVSCVYCQKIIYKQPKQTKIHNVNECVYLIRIIFNIFTFFCIKEFSDLYHWNMILSDGDVDDDIQYWSRDLFFSLQNKHENMEKLQCLHWILNCWLYKWVFYIYFVSSFCLYKHLNIPFDTRSINWM